MKKLKLNVQGTTNEDYELKVVTLLLTDDKIETIKKSKAFLEANKDIDTIRVRIDEPSLPSMSDTRLGYGFIHVSNADALYFIGTDHYDSANQVETEAFELD